MVVKANWLPIRFGILSTVNVNVACKVLANRKREKECC